MKICLLNVKYSNNLGDGIIAECLESELAKAIPGSEVYSIDVGGRDFYGDFGLTSAKDQGIKSLLRSVAKWGFGLLPEGVKTALAIKISEKAMSTKMRPKWQPIISKSDMIVVGGGHLFGDDQLYFPLRLNAAAEEVKALNKPMAVYAVGVAKKLSTRALELFSVITNNPDLFFVGVRDKESVDHWNGHFDRKVDIVTRDPGLLANAVYADLIAKPENQATEKVIGINVMHDRAIVKYSGAKETITPNEDLLFDVGMKLAALGKKIVYFTNGATEDEVVKDKIKARVQSSGKDFAGNIGFVDRLMTPTQLALQIAKLDTLIAHRLHANILSYSMKIPHVGLGWDAKMDSFFKSVDRYDYFLQSEGVTADQIVEKALATQAERVNEDVHGKVLAEARHDLMLLVEKITGRMGR
ncbi:MAG: polysaccharide pyruvyl transferase family protein [Pseudobdellovibrionaceae bacterium]|jgi:polysaccharide pyruvyl transferase WcaK-like protein|nr:polysaccharide pyruvyl transferase family protein [Pseudobdellovibrionaceae bacterium]